MGKEENESGLFDGIDFNMFNEEEPVEVETKKEVDVSLEDDDTEDETIETVPSDESDKENVSSSSSSYQVLAKALSEEGIFSISEDELKNVDGAEKIIELVQNEINTRVNEYKNSLPKDVKEILDGYDDGADLDDIMSIKKTQVVFSKIKPEDLEDNEDLKRKVLYKDLELKGMSPEDIEEEITDIFSLGKEDTKSLKALNNILRKTSEDMERIRKEAKDKDALQQKQYAERVGSIQKAVSSTTEMGGVPVTKKIQDTAFKAMTVAVAEHEGVAINAITKSRLENPVEFDKNVAVLWALTNGFKNYSLFGKAAKKSALSDLDKVAEGMAKDKQLGLAPVRRSQQLLEERTILSDIDINTIK